MTVGTTNNDATVAFRTAYRKLRKAKRLSNQKISDRLAASGHHISRATLANLELGRRHSLDLDAAVGIADVLGVALHDLLHFCDRCMLEPPEGFTCNECHREAGRG